MRTLAPALVFCFSSAVLLPAETGSDAWLRYAPQRVTAAEPSFPSGIVALERSEIIDSAQNELIRGIRGMRGRILRIEPNLPREDAIVLGRLASVRRALPEARIPQSLPPESYVLRSVAGANGKRYVVVAGPDDRGVLYGAFALLRRMQLGEAIASLDERQSPSAPIRWVNQWDNLDGSIERGYGGRSIFWDAGHVRPDLRRVADYGRLLASVGINGCAISNVNADRRLLSPEYFPEIERIAAALRPWGVRVVLPVDFGSPQSVGKLDSFDPLDPRVAAWWNAEADALYRAVPDLAGFLIKADSEGRVGPSFYHRTHAEAANLLARALKPHGGLLLYRGFVYDHHMDWRDPKNDRARAAYDNFQKLDGQFDGNAVLQVKNGPIDFQVREPVSPLIGSLVKTKQVLELQITQEYMGQAHHTVFLVPQWKEILDFAIGTGGASVKSLVGGFAGVANVGLDENWTGNQLSQANLYGFGRLTWNPNLTSQSIAEDWTRLTFGDNPDVTRTIGHILLTSWRTYEDYTGPLGLQTLTDIVGNHYGVAVEASENNSWGQWHRADSHGVGMDRSVATGTGYAGQYRPGLAALYEKAATTPDDLLLFFHHVPYGYVLHSGQTVIQTIYDLHYRGAAAVDEYVRAWNSLAGRIDGTRFEEVQAQLEYQAGQAELWRDAVCHWFLRASGIPDSKQRVGREPGRVEAESMQLDGYSVVDVKPWEAAGGGKAVVCKVAVCTATMRYSGPTGWRSLRVRYFAQNTGAARLRLRVGEQAVDEWVSDAVYPTGKIDSSSSTLRTTAKVALHPGDEIVVEGHPDAGDLAGIDYIEIAP